MLKQRIITALILAPLALAGVFLLEPGLFSVFVGAILALAAWEWANLSNWESQAKRVGYAFIIGVIIFCILPSISVAWVMTLSVLWWAIATLLVVTYPDTVSLWRSTFVRLMIGVLVLVPMWKALVFIRGATFLPNTEINSLWLILYVLLLVWAADTGAYFAGRKFGNKKLAPKVSPGKSWAGAWGGLAATALLAIIGGNLLGMASGMIIQFLFVTIIVAAISIIGDLTESMFKRQRGIKDSSNLLPGHGGILDRVDSLVAAIPLFVFALHSLGWVA